MTSRLFLDVSTIDRWPDAHGGIARVEAELARCALQDRHDVGFVSFDRYAGAYRGLHPNYVRALVSLKDPTCDKYAPPRATGKSSYRERPQFGKDAVILAPGAVWDIQTPAALTQMKREAGFRFVMVCQDVIATMFPQWFTDDLVSRFGGYYSSAPAFVDRFICISRVTARDLATFLQSQRLPQPEIRVQPLASRWPANDKTNSATGTLPSALHGKRFVLFVSTVEPRKNHDLLHRVWKRLVLNNPALLNDHRLVFVGHEGWKTRGFLKTIASDPAGRGSILHFQDLPDHQLIALYQNAAFCVYPSFYEGFGLPIVEAFGFGRAVIGSTGGAVPETISELGPCIDAQDEDGWHAVMHAWISDPRIVAAQEAKIRATYKPRTWSEAARGFFEDATAP